MEKEFTHIDILDAWFRNEMNEDQRQVFEQRLATEPSLKAEFDLYAEMIAGIQTFGDHALMAQIRQTHSQMKSEGFFQEKREAKLVSFRSNAVRWSAAAAVALLAVVTAWWYWSSSAYDKAFAAHYQPNPASLNTLLDSLETLGFAAGKDEAYRDFVAGVQAYEKGDFAQAEKQLAAWHRLHPDDDNGRYMLALSLLAQQRFGKAANLLQPLIDNQKQELAHEARFYLALAYCKQPFQRSAARRLLQEIASDSSSPYRQQAADILAQLESW
ncbi:MAG: hypothetical protein IPN33_08645 [Saprospiraceae bacterium]|nr:hypothetical protein [Saprospiraceae bacterium]